jgi:hypothetical protein
MAFEEEPRPVFPLIFRDQDGFGSAVDEAELLPNMGRIGAAVLCHKSAGELSKHCDDIIPCHS